MRTIVHISDIHFGSHDEKKAGALLESLRGINPDIVVVSGDLTQRARRAEFELARDFLSQIAAPKLIVPGNHDMPLFDVFARLLSPFEKFEAIIGPVRIPGCYYEDSDIAVLGLNTARRLTGKNGRISRAQTLLLQEKFRNAPSSALKMVVTHHPLAAPDGEDVSLAWRAREALPALAEAGVHLVLSGHHHRAVSGEVDAEFCAGGTLLTVHAGTAISRRTRGEENSYNVLRVAQDTLTISVMSGSEAGFHGGTTTNFRLCKSGWISGTS